MEHEIEETKRGEMGCLTEQKFEDWEGEEEQEEEETIFFLSFFFFVEPKLGSMHPLFPLCFLKQSRYPKFGIF